MYLRRRAASRTLRVNSDGGHDTDNHDTGNHDRQNSELDGERLQHNAIQDMPGRAANQTRIVASEPTKGSI